MPKATATPLNTLLNTDQAAEVLSVASGTLRYWRCAGKGPAFHKLEGGVRYNPADLEEYLRVNRHTPSVREMLAKEASVDL